MNAELQQDAIAIACGWKRGIVIRYYGRPDEILPYGWTSPEGWPFSDSIFAKAYRNDRESCMMSPPDYLNDLNAMHEAEEVLTGNVKDAYINYLVMHSISDGNSHVLFSTAQRAEAFLRTLNLWVD